MLPRPPAHVALNIFLHCPLFFFWYLHIFILIINTKNNKNSILSAILLENTMCKPYAVYNRAVTISNCQMVFLHFGS